MALNQEIALTVVDEIQRLPDLFPLLRGLADSPQRRTSWLVLGNASPGIIKGVSESLADRVEMVNLAGLNILEVGTPNLETLWFRGEFTRSFLAGTDSDSLIWRRQFMAMVAERDLPRLGVKLPPTTLLRLWTMMAHWHGQIWPSVKSNRPR